MPSPGSGGTLTSLTGMVRTRSALSDPDATIVSEIGRQLDGIPLAIEFCSGLTRGRFADEGSYRVPKFATSVIACCSCCDAAAAPSLAAWAPMTTTSH